MNRLQKCHKKRWAIRTAKAHAEFLTRVKGWQARHVDLGYSSVGYRVTLQHTNGEVVTVKYSRLFGPELV